MKKRGNWYLTFSSDSRNHKGEIVVWSESTSIWGNLKKKVNKNQNPKRTQFQSRIVAITHDPGSLTHGWATGDSLPSLTQKITIEKIDQYEEI
jgi:hypothetical protein